MYYIFVALLVTVFSSSQENHVNKSQPTWVSIQASKGRIFRGGSDALFVYPRNSERVTVPAQFGPFLGVNNLLFFLSFLPLSFLLTFSCPSSAPGLVPS